LTILLFTRPISAYISALTLKTTTTTSTHFAHSFAMNKMVGAPLCRVSISFPLMVDIQQG